MSRFQMEGEFISAAVCLSGLLLSHSNNNEV